MYTFTESID